MGVGVVGPETDGGADRGDRLVVVVPGITQGLLEVGVGLGVVGPEGDGGAVLTDGLLQSPRDVQPEPDAGAVLGARIRQPPRDGEDGAEVGVDTGVVGLEAGGLAQDRNPFGHGRQRPRAIAAFLEQVTVEDMMLADVGAPS